jgi:hypothetical protein
MDDVHPTVDGEALMMETQPASSFDANVLIARLRRLATLDTTVFDEVRMDRTATVPAIVTVIGSIFLFGVGGWLWWLFNAYDGVGISSGDILLRSTIIGTILGIVFWAAWVGITYVMLHQVFRARVDLNDLIRVMGFATMPLALGVLMFIPVLEFAIGLTALALMVGTTVIAVQSATDAPVGRVLAATCAGFLLWAVMLALFVGDENAYAPGVFIFDVGVEFLRS